MQNTIDWLNSRTKSATLGFQATPQMNQEQYGNPTEFTLVLKVQSVSQWFFHIIALKTCIILVHMDKKKFIAFEIVVLPLEVSLYYQIIPRLNM